MKGFLRQITNLSLVSGLSLVSFCSQAMISTDTLPEKVDSASVRYGVINGLDQKYTDNGTLVRLGDLKSVAFDAEHLQKFNADAKKLITALNRFGSQNLGSNFDLGVLRISTEPQVKYYAPVYARGVSSRWTLGVGIPVINYQNKINLSQQFSNVDFYKKQFSGLSAELDQALSTNLASATNDALISKGYRPLQNHNDNFLGDVQIASLYKIYDEPDQAVLYQAILGLPTGPRYNADDLAAMNIFGRTTLTHTLAYSKKWAARFSLVPYVSYLMNAPDQVVARVPTSEDDVLPEESSKESVQRKIGDTAFVGAGAFYDVNDAFSVGAGYEYSHKAADQFHGDRGSRYDLLAANTEMLAQRWKAQLSYSTVTSYLHKIAAVPMILSLEVSDIFAGSNVERQLAQELNMMMFF